MTRPHPRNSVSIDLGWSPGTGTLQSNLIGDAIIRPKLEPMVSTALCALATT